MRCPPKYTGAFLCLLALPFFLLAQEVDPVREQQLEDLAGKQEAEIRDDSYLQQLETWRRHRIHLNSVLQDELRDLNILTEIQVASFFAYRNLFGKLISVYELQAIPGWDAGTIRKILPYVTVGEDVSLSSSLRQRLHGGISAFVWRSAEQLEKSKGYVPPAGNSSSYYMGSRLALFFRYTYHYRNLLQYGVLGDKDAGEQFFRGKQRLGFDFYSFHLFLKNLGIIQSLALGDFTVNMGQGLIQWQTLAFSKGADILGVKRQSEILEAYNSAGETNFHRGAGITLKKGKYGATLFFSLKKISVNLVADSSGSDQLVSSFETSGYHRTPAENADRNDLQQTAFGGNISYSAPAWKIGINAVQYYFSSPVRKRDEPYNLFAIRGNNWRNLSADFSYTHQNIHVFGELATDQHFNKAVIAGLLASLQAHTDLALVYRNISSRYQSLYASAFTENASPSNEEGIYAGISLRPFPAWRIDAYADVFSFPWLKYTVDAPSYGSGFFVQVFFQPGKTWSVYTRYKTGSKQSDETGTDTALHRLTIIPTRSWRMEYHIQLNREMTVRNRVEFLWYDKNAADREQGFLGLFDFFYHPRLQPFAGNLRLSYFETGGYNSRIYAYENDVLYHFSIPFVYNRGFRYYVNLSMNLKKMLGLQNNYRANFTGWIKWSQSLYPPNSVIGSGLDQLTGNNKSDVTLQILLGW